MLSCGSDDDLPSPRIGKNGSSQGQNLRPRPGEPGHPSTRETLNKVSSPEPSALALNPQLLTLNPQLYSPIPSSLTLNPNNTPHHKPHTRNPKPQTPNPEP